MRFQPLEKLINLHDGYRCRFKIDGLQVLLIQQGGTHYLLEAQCPHKGHLLDDARIAELTEFVETARRLIEERSGIPAANVMMSRAGRCESIRLLMKATR